MDDAFELPVQYKNVELVFPAQFRKAGYSYKIEVEIYGETFVFEPDEERSWRALTDPEMFYKTKIDRGLIQAIAESLDEILK